MKKHLIKKERYDTLYGIKSKTKRGIFIRTNIRIKKEEENK